MTSTIPVESELSGGFKMDKIVINGGNTLRGEVQVSGAKNAVLPVLTASLLASKGQSILRNVPALSDVETINNVISTLNAEVAYDKDSESVTVDATKTLNEEAPYEYVSKMRASILVMGPLLARLGHAKVALREVVRLVLVQLNNISKDLKNSVLTFIWMVDLSTPMPKMV